MADPAHALEERLRAAVAAAYPEHADADPIVRPATNSRFGDYQANAAMALAKRVGSPSREVADRIVEHLDPSGLLVSADVAGPGFINLRLDDRWLSGQISAIVADSRIGVAADARSERVVVDYSSPNIAKEMHVGHLRSTIIGDALVRLFEFLGHTVVRQNHVGDWGTQFGMLIEYLLDRGEDGVTRELSIDDLNDFYQQARQKFDADSDFKERARQRVVALQSGDAETLRLWGLFVAESERHCDEVYSRLGVLLTDADFAGESIYNPDLQPLAEELEQRQVAVESDGALCVFPPGFAGRDGTPLPLIVRKSDGGFGYDATDLAAVRHRVADLGASYLVYVVGAPQAQHLQMVFAGAEMAGWIGGETGRRAVHVSFGSVLGADGKTLKTRSGESPKLIDLLDEAVLRAAAIVAERSDLPKDEQATIAEVVGIGCIKYADLSSDRVKDYVFDYDRMLATDGNTAAYLQYAGARCRSILRRAEEDGTAGPSAAVIVTEPAERDLALQVLRLDGAIRAAVDELAPHKLTTHLFDLAQTFTAFYEACPVLRAPTPEARSSRLVLTRLTADALAVGLGLLGIGAPPRM